MASKIMELAALAGVDDEEDVEQEISRLQLAIELKREAQRRAAASSAPRKPLVFEYITEVPDGPKWLIQDLMPAEGTVLIGAQKKVGKTTLIGNVLRSLITGQMFLGEFRTFRKVKVGLVDLEMTPRMLAEWHRDAGLLGEVPVLQLRGFAQSFAAFDDDCAAELAEEIRASGIDVLIIDPLGPLIRAAGIPEDDNTQIGNLLMWLDSVRVRAGLKVLIQTHHNGKDDSRGFRGASAFGDVPDSLWYLSKDGRSKDDDEPDGIRTLTAEGRDVDLSRRLSYTSETRELRTTVPGETRISPGGKMLILNALRAQGPLSGSALFEQIKPVGYRGNPNKLNKELNGLQDDGDIRNVGTDKRPRWAAADELTDPAKEAR